MQSVNLALMGCESFDQVQSVYMTGRRMLGEILSGTELMQSMIVAYFHIMFISFTLAVEFFDLTCARLVSNHLSLSPPLATEYPLYVLIETSGSNPTHDEEVCCEFYHTRVKIFLYVLQKLSECLEKLMTEGIISDGTVATDFTKVKTSKLL